MEQITCGVRGAEEYSRCGRQIERRTCQAGKPDLLLLMHCSIIIPTLNEAPQIATAIAGARALDPAEIIVVDGGSTDDTLAAAHAADQILTAARGRASQQNTGAASSRGDVLLFLHADCRLEPGSLNQIAGALADSHCV